MTSVQIKNITTILRRINTYKAFDVARIICNNNYLYFNSNNLLKNIINDKFNGGAKEKIIKFEYKEHIFNFEQTKEDNLIIIKVYTTNGMDECIFIIIDSSLKLAILQGIYNFPECVKDNLLPDNVGGIGSILLQTTIEFLKTHKDKYKINKIILTDNSNKICTTSTIHLAPMYFLLNGNTWYGKYGFRPYNDTKNDLDKVKYKRYIKSQDIISKIKVKDVKDLKKMLINAYNETKNKNEMNLTEILKIVDKMKNDLLKNFIHVFLIHYDKTCEMFGNFYMDLYDEIGLYDFYKNSFYLEI